MKTLNYFWHKPEFKQNRFGFEVTMYINVRQELDRHNIIVKPAKTKSYVLITQNQTRANSDVLTIDNALGHPVKLSNAPREYAVAKIHAAPNYAFEVIRHNSG